MLVVVEHGLVEVFRHKIVDDFWVIIRLLSVGSGTLLLFLLERIEPFGKRSHEETISSASRPAK